MDPQVTERIYARIPEKCRTGESSSVRTNSSVDSGVGETTRNVRNDNEHLKKENIFLNTELENANKELQSLKARLNGFQTVSVLLKENVKEKGVLQNKISRLEGIVRAFQNRLLQLGASTSLNLEKDEMFYPSMDNDNCESIASDICTPNEKLKHAAEELSKLKQEKQQKEQRIRTLLTHLQQVKDELETLRKAMASNDNEKDSEIMQLKSQIKFMSETSSVKESRRQSLNEDREHLQQRLQTTSQQCRELARRLEDYKHCVARNGDQTQQLVENEQLRLQYNEVLQMNTRWQSFNEEQERKISGLNDRIAELESQVREVRPVPSEEHQRQFDKLLLQAKKRIEEEREEKENVLSENKALEMALKQEEDEKKRLQTLLEAGGGGESRPEDKEHIEFLKAQIQSCTDDFELERQDREKAHERIAALEVENKHLKDQLAYLQPDRRTSCGRRQVCLNRYQQEYGYNNELVARGFGGRDVADAFAYDLVIDGVKGNNESGNGFGEIRPGIASLPRKMEKPKEASTKHVSDENLECPRCGRLYPADKDHAFMTHVDMCCD